MRQRVHASQGALVFEQAPQFDGRRQGAIEQRLEFGEGIRTGREKRLVKQHVFRFPTGGFKHENGPASAKPVGGLVDQEGGHVANRRVSSSLGGVSRNRLLPAGPT